MAPVTNLLTNKGNYFNNSLLFPTTTSEPLPEAPEVPKWYAINVLSSPMLLYISILIGTGTSDGSPRLIGSNIKLPPQTGMKNTNTAH